MKIKNQLYGPVLSLFILLLLLVPPVWSSSTKTNLSTKQKVDELAIEKTGFFKGVVDGLVRLQDEATYRITSYLAAPGMIVTKQGVEIDLAQLNNSPIVKLIIVDAEVIEIILLRGPS
ncbi:MAG: hypothetical protein IBX47_08435 [Desulfuromonadales bacterium]|nr:hypothetical protein [Desulfuromonadales bacterium]